MRKPLLVGIAVHKAKFLDVLPGVLEANEKLCAWAADRYDVVSIDDRKSAVTIDRIRRELTPRDEEGDPDPSLLLDRPRIIVYFAGHGFAAWPDQYWILSAGPNQPNERISANSFRDTLASYEPKQIAFISDACRSASAFQGLANAVLDRAEGSYRNPQKDVFYSCQDGKSSYAVPAKDGKPPYLVFSSVLLKALSEPDGENLDVVLLDLKKRAVTSQSLSTYLEKHVSAAAMDVDRIQNTQCDPGFRPRDHIYIEFDAGDGGPEGGDDGSDDDLVRGPRPRTTADKSKDFEGMAEFLRAGFEREERARDASDRQRRFALSRSEWRGPLVRRVGEYLRETTNYEPALAVVGTNSARVIPGHTVDGVSVDRYPYGPMGEDMTLVRFRDHPRASKNVGIRFAHDSIAFVPVYPDMHSICVLEDTNNRRKGLQILSWISIYGDGGDQLMHSAEALKGFTSGLLRSTDAGKLAEQIRYTKHLDPMMGVVAAYLYRSAGDIDNIRRMAFYYVHHNQPIPFDLAILGGLRIHPDRDQFVVEVPAVTEAEGGDMQTAVFTREATPSTDGRLGGLIPILRAGWPYCQRAIGPVHRTCLDFIDSLSSAPVTTFVGKKAVKAISRAYLESEL
ncbi:hypothetical protein HFO42_22890 [Rhizobium leguminosarum]|uniref:Peptidase C14 caspase domain-containing protein n=1 Tax=Rhizobium leguminosarum TaxID=384 RepID=A0AAJ1EFP2_RHILE|nr:caspase family protein [Rhizobium leguminosarum]MBY5533810.1 hypothetical protein [Rhizobium leguminosarum]MBY5594898.1 hypothetical protein [Rhizobium leguminosarum]MBY5630923.1 hypothetical protein [Rhizobium leguminosarum]MBY5652656.1 hypothetical protein [Rhizobium leguminosarum]